MSKQKLMLFLPIIFCSILTWGQTPNTIKVDSAQLYFKPPIKKQTKFRKKYNGYINGRIAELTFIEDMDRGQLLLTIVLNDLTTDSIYIGKAKIEKNTHKLTNLNLKHNRDSALKIQNLYLHHYNPNYINLILNNGSLGVFVWEGKKSFAPEDLSEKIDQERTFVGNFEGRIDGRLANLNLDIKDHDLIINLSDVEHQQQYNGIIENFDENNNPLLIENVLLKSANGKKEIKIDLLALDSENRQIISGKFTERERKVGLFFVKRDSIKIN